MSPEQVQSILQEFASKATRVGVRIDGSEVWRFVIESNAYDLHFWPHDDTPVGKYQSGVRAAREFEQLQTLQKLVIPATRVIANLKGFRIGDRKGDACIVVHDTNTTPLNQTLASRAFDRHDRLELTAHLIERLEALHRAKRCPTPLTIDRFAVRGTQVFVHDAAGEMGGLVTDERLRELGCSTRFVTGDAERLRLWKHFSNAPMPRPARRDAAALVRDAMSGEVSFGTLSHEQWTGRFAKQLPFVIPWSSLNGTVLRADAWRTILPQLIDGSHDGVLKNDRSGRVYPQRVTLGDREIDLIVKRPAFKPGLRGTLQQFRTSRVMRTWKKTWRMLGLGFRCEIPLLMIEHRRGARVVDQLLICERVPGDTLARVDLDGLPDAARFSLLRDAGRVLRRIESFGFTHADAKNTNWIAWTDGRDRILPVLIDLDGIRFYRWRGLGYERFVRAMKLHPHARSNDLDAIAAGYQQ